MKISKFSVILTGAFLLISPLFSNRVDSAHGDKSSIDLDTTTDFISTTENNIKETTRGTPYEAKMLSMSAYKYIKENGKEKAYKEFAKQGSEFHYKDLYIFVVDMKGNMLVHGKDKELMNTNLYDLKDSTGNLFIQKFIRLMESYDSSWTEYFWKNYETQKVESKLTYLIKIDESTFLGCGAYNMQ